MRSEPGDTGLVGGDCDSLPLWCGKRVKEGAVSKGWKYGRVG